MKQCENDDSFIVMQIYVSIPVFCKESSLFVNIDMNIPIAYKSRDIRDKTC
jgi:hypothetical protein